MSREKLPQSTQTKIFIMSRRRCCICYGLDRDEARKKGQIAHLDGDPANNAFENLAYLCLDHHDEFDTRTSQSKQLTIEEVRRYREELYDHFSTWSGTATRQHLLNFLASRITVGDIADAVVEVASRMYFYGPRHAHDVLTWPKLRASEADTLLNHLLVLDACASWGLLTYEEEDVYEADAYQHTLVTVHHKPICQEVAKVVEERITEKGELNWQP